MHGERQQSGVATKKGRIRLRSFWTDTPGRCAARLLSLDGKWLECSVTRHPISLSVDQEGLVVSGMSGSPIVSTDGHAIGSYVHRLSEPNHQRVSA